MRYRLEDRIGAVVASGEATAVLDGQALLVVPATGAPLRLTPLEMAGLHVGDASVRISLSDGGVLSMDRLGGARGRMAAELVDLRVEGLVGALGLAGIGRPETFRARLGESEARILLFDDGVVVVPVAGWPDAVRHAWLDSVRLTETGHCVVVAAAGRAPLVLGGLGRRLREFRDLVEAGRARAGARTAVFLGRALPGVEPARLQRLTGLLRDGAAVPKGEICAVDPSAWSGLTAAAVLPDRSAMFEHLARLGPVWLGFRQTESVEVAASGGLGPQYRELPEPRRDRDARGATGSARDLLRDFAFLNEALGGHRLPGTSPLAFPVFEAGLLGPSARFPGSTFQDGRQPRPRPDVDRGVLEPPRTAFERLTAAHPAPTVLAFAVGQIAPDRIAYLALNAASASLYVFRGGPDSVPRCAGRSTWSATGVP